MKLLNILALFLTLVVAPVSWCVVSAQSDTAGAGPGSALAVLVIAGVLYNGAKNS